MELSLPIKHNESKKYRFFHLLGCSWSWRLRRSRRTDPCPAGREWSCFHWTGSGTCWNPPSTTPLAVKKKKKKEKSYIIDKLLVFESQFSTCVHQCNFCVIIWHLKQLEIIMDLIFGLVRISILMQFKNKKKWWLRVAWSQVIKSCNAKNLFLIHSPALDSSAPYMDYHHLSDYCAVNASPLCQNGVVTSHQNNKLNSILNTATSCKGWFLVRLGGEGKRGNAGKSLTAQFFAGPRQQVVEDVEAPLLFRLTDGPRLFQQIWSGWGQGRAQRGNRTSPNPVTSLSQMNDNEIITVNHETRGWLTLAWRPQTQQVDPVVSQVWKAPRRKRIQVSMLAPTM